MSFQEVSLLINQVHEIFNSFSILILLFIVIGIIMKGNVYNHNNHNVYS